MNRRKENHTRTPYLLKEVGPSATPLLTADVCMLAYEISSSPQNQTSGKARKKYEKFFRSLTT
jgi:hypothetical protein